MVEPFWSGVCGPDPQEARAILSQLRPVALASGRGLRADQRRSHYLWRAVDHEGEVLKVFATKRRDRKAAKAFPKRAMKSYGRPRRLVMDRLLSYGAAMQELGNAARQECGRWLNNRAENSHQPFRR